MIRLANSQALMLEHESNMLNLIEKIDEHLEDDPVFSLVCGLSDQYFGPH